MALFIFTPLYGHYGLEFRKSYIENKKWPQILVFLYREHSRRRKALYYTVPQVADSPESTFAPFFLGNPSLRTMILHQIIICSRKSPASAGLVLRGAWLRPAGPSNGRETFMRKIL